MLTACNWAGEKANNALNKGGELVGSAATEVVEGVTSGVERTWRVDVSLREPLGTQGLTLGKTMVEADSSGRNNQLIIYLSARNNVQDTLTAVALDQDGLEMGRTRVPVVLSAGQGDFFSLQFQDYTDLERKSRVELSQ